ncbi:MAG: hypothetical protein IJT88_07015 [Kiritimatiellae bacterium]|nr:hypothetical protein [Kiritimatiellia bacterium]
MKRKRQVFGCWSKGLAVVLLGGLVLWLGTLVENRPSMVFRRVIQNPIPKSVRVLETRCDGGFDEVCWLHFLASPTDLEQILARKGFQPGHVNIATASAPSWWKTNGTAYHASDRVMGMYVSADKTEAYAVVLH